MYLQPPPTRAILDLAAERRDTAIVRGDAATARRLDALRQNLLRGARLAWAGGELLVESLNHPGVVYSVGARSCDCKARRGCWHLTCRSLVEELQQTAADTADMALDLAELDGGERCDLWARAVAAADRVVAQALAMRGAVATR